MCNRIFTDALFPEYCADAVLRRKILRKIRMELFKSKYIERTGRLLTIFYYDRAVLIISIQTLYNNCI